MKQPLHNIGDKFELDNIVIEIICVSPMPDYTGEYVYFVSSKSTSGNETITFDTIDEFDLILYRKIF